MPAETETKNANAKTQANLLKTKANANLTETKTSNLNLTNVKTPETNANSSKTQKPNLHKKPAKHKVRRNVKDSIFCDLFSQKVYIKALFESLHNGESVDESEIEILTLKNKLKSTFYNDLGFCVKDRIIILGHL